MGRFPSEIDEMPWPDFLQLVALNYISPIGDEHADIQQAVIGAELINTVRTTLDASARPIDPRDLLAFRDRDEAPGPEYQPANAADEKDAVLGLFSGIRVRKSPPAPTSPA